MKIKWFEKEVLLKNHAAVLLFFLVASVKNVLTADEVFHNRQNSETCKLLDISPIFHVWDRFNLGDQPLNGEDSTKSLSVSEDGFLYSSDCSPAANLKGQICFNVVKKLVNKYSFIDGKECFHLEKALEAQQNPGGFSRSDITFSQKKYNIYVPYPWKDQYVNIKETFLANNQGASISCKNLNHNQIKLLDGGRLFISREVQHVTQKAINCLLQNGETKSDLIVHFEDNFEVLIRKRRNTPIFFEKNFYSAEVKEDASPLDTVILTLKVRGGSGKYLFSKARDPKTDAIFKIESESGNVILLKKLNREDGAERFSIDAKAADAADPNNFIETPIKIKVLDVNDNSPVFDQSSYQMEVDEGQASNKYILTVKATDPDDGVNREIVYSIVQKPNIVIPFQVDKRSGAIKNIEVLDREKNPYYNFTVKAEDQGVPKLSSTVMVSISLRDINDNYPTFSKSLYKLNIPENTTVGTTVFKFDVTDADVGSNGVISFNPLSGTRFRIDTTSGEIILNQLVDYDAYERFFKFSVVAFDKGSPPKHANTEVEVCRLL